MNVQLPTDTARTMVAGDGQLDYDCDNYSVNKGDVLFLPAVGGVCNFRPHSVVTLLEISLPEGT